MGDAAMGDAAMGDAMNAHEKNAGHARPSCAGASRHSSRRWCATPTRLGAILFVASLLVAISSGFPREAAADEASEIESVAKMTRRSLEEYENLNFDGARKTLNAALEEASGAGLARHPVVADVHVMLGVVILAGGSKGHDEAIAEFRKAMKILPAVGLSQRVANPEIQQVFDEAAAMESKAGGATSEAKAGTGRRQETARNAETADEASEGKSEKDDDSDGEDEDDSKDDSDGGDAADVAETESQTGAFDRSWYVGIGLGSGVGWASGPGEVTDVNVASGFRPSSVAHVLPELGYFVAPNVLLSLQLRLQFISGATTEHAPNMTVCGSDQVCSPSKGATAVFARAAWFLGDGAMFRPYVSAMLGVGQVRHLVAVPGLADCGDDPAHPVGCVDTVSAGPVFLGPGGGFTINLAKAFALVLSANSFVGFPNFTFHVDLDAGVALEF